MSYEVAYRSEFTDIEGCDWRIDVLSEPFTNWFLPSKDELMEMYKELHLYGLGGFNDGLAIGYWSSTEHSATNATAIEFIDGQVWTYAKSNSGAKTRAVRKFTSTDSYSLRSIGPAGGLIFYKSGNNYLEAGPVDQANSKWSNVTTDAVGGTGAAIGTGEANTIAIIAQSGHTVSAASIILSTASAGKPMQLFGDALNIDYLSPSDRLIEAPIKGSLAVFNVLSRTDFQYSPLYAVSDFQYPVNIYYFDGATAVLFWKGWIVTGNYSEPYDGTSYVVSLAANDGLGVLKNIMFDDAGEYYDGRKLQSEIILDILNKISITTFKEFINIYELEHDKTEDDSPLDQTKLDVDVFKDMTCYEVLEHILTSYNAIIRQHLGEYYIYRPVDLVEDLVNGRIFSGITTKDSIAMLPEQWINRTGTVSDLLNIEGGYLHIDPPAKIIKIFHDYGSKESWLDNWKFENKTYKDGVWDFWTDVNHAYSRPLSDYLPSEKEGVAIINISIVTIYRLRQSFGQGYVPSTRDMFMLEFDYGFYNKTAGTIEKCDLWIHVAGVDVPSMRLQHKTDRLAFYHLGENESEIEWATGDDDRTIKIIADCESGWSGWKTFKRKFTGLPDVGDLIFELHSGLQTSNVYSCFKNIKLYMADNDGIKMPSTWYSRGRLSTASQTYNKMRFPEFFKLATEKEYTFTNAIDHGTRIEHDVVLGDVKNVQADNILEQYAGSIATYVDVSMQPSRSWSADAGATYKDIITLKGDELKSHYSRPKQMITMPIIDKGETPALNLLGRLTDSLNLVGATERIFAINSARLNVRDRLWDVDLVEIIQPPAPVQPIVVVDESDEIETFTIDSYSGSIAIGSTSLTFSVIDPDGWATGTGVDMDYHVKDSGDNVLYSGTLDDVLDGGTFGATVTLSREAVAGETLTIIIGIGEVVVTPVVSCAASFDVIVWAIEDAGGSIAIGNTSLTFAFYVVSSWAEPGTPVDMNYVVLDADDNELAYGTIADVYDRLAIWGDTVSISRNAVSGDVFTVLLGTIAV